MSSGSNLSALIIAVLGSALAVAATGKQGAPVHATPCISAEQREILRHMSIAYLDDGQGGTVKTIRIKEANLQIVNGSGTTDGIPDGLGNLIVGYNELGSFQGDNRTGSHNIVGGRESSFSSWGGFVVGLGNTVSAPVSSVSGGWGNTASGYSSSVSGGAGNTASYDGCSVSGGSGNLASGFNASVSGGDHNVAAGLFSNSVSGGKNNYATGGFASVSGGRGNTARGGSTSVSGGRQNEANGDFASISGGQGNRAYGYYSSVSGGSGRAASGPHDWVSGSLLEDN